MIENKGNKCAALRVMGNNAARRYREMRKYLQLMTDIAEQAAIKAEQSIVLCLSLDEIKALLSAAERKIETADKAG